MDATVDHCFLVETPLASPIPCTTLYYFSANICLFLLGLPPAISWLSQSLKQALHNEASQGSALGLSFVYPFPGQRLAYLWCQLIPICWFFSLFYSSLLIPYLKHCITVQLKLNSFCFPKICFYLCIPSDTMIYPTLTRSPHLTYTTQEMIWGTVFLIQPLMAHI